MKIKYPIYIKVLIAICGILIIALFVQSIFMNNRVTRNDLTKISLIGTYTINDSESFEIVDSYEYDIVKGETIVFRGHFSEEVEKNMCLFFLCDSINVIFQINGETKFDYGKDKPSIVKSEGSSWKCYQSEGITTSDEIEIIITNPYHFRSSDVVGSFMNSIYSGLGPQFVNELFLQNHVSLFSGLTVVSLGVSLLIITISACIARVKASNRMVLLAIFTIFVGMSVLLFENRLFLSLYIRNLLFLQMFDNLSIYGASIVLLAYFLCYYKDKNCRTSMILTEIIMSCFTITVIVCQMFGWCDVIETMPIGAIMVGVSVSITYICSIIEMRKFKQKNIIRFSYSHIPLCVGILAEMLNVFIGFAPFYLQFTIGFVVFITIQLVCVGFIIKDSTEMRIKAHQLENELTESRINIMMSQVKPHFIYNALSTISSLCQDNEQATNAIYAFSNYLRNNMDSLTISKPILFSQEVEHVLNYLELQKLQFGDRIEIKTDFMQDEFFIPTLTLQPLVENSVKYGLRVCEKIIIEITSFKNDSNYFVVVKDNGPGFDMNEKYSDDKSHVGISNVTNRLMLLLEGSLEVKSEINKGTTITISLPIKNSEVGT